MVVTRAAFLYLTTDPDTVAYQNKYLNDAATENGYTVTCEFNGVDELMADGGASFDVVLTAEDVKVAGVEVIKV